MNTVDAFLILCWIASVGLLVSLELGRKCSIMCYVVRYRCCVYIYLLKDELRKFIKFACNQERIPFGLPCRDGQDSDMNIPPYPMKIAPPDGRGKCAATGQTAASIQTEQQ